MELRRLKNIRFLGGVEWDNIRYTKAPFIPELNSEWDTRYFDTFPEQEPFYPPEKKKRVKKVNFG
jgi:serine/threonine kinase 38